MNFNFKGGPEYDLNASLQHEMVNLYGVLVKLLLTEKINVDDVVFGDYTHIKTDNSQIYEIYMLPENAEDWDTGADHFTQYGLVNFDNITMFVTKASLDPIPDVIDQPLNLVGNVVVFPNNKVMEITDAVWTVPGINNLFTETDEKSIIKLSMKPHDAKLFNELDPAHITAPQNPRNEFDPGSTDPDEPLPYEGLEHYFQELVDEAEEQDTEAEVTPSVATVDDSTPINTIVEKPIVDNTEEDVWGKFG